MVTTYDTFRHILPYWLLSWFIGFSWIGLLNCIPPVAASLPWQLPSRGSLRGNILNHGGESIGKRLLGQIQVES